MTLKFIDDLMGFHVLDHGWVRLVDHLGSDLAISRAARVSYAAEWRAGRDEGSDHKLIHSLWKRGHGTPFEAVVLTFDVKLPIFVARQWHRHRTWTYNELSARYRELPEEFYVPAPDVIGTQSKSSKQGRDLAAADSLSYDNELADYQTQCTQAFATYRRLLDAGWPRELARMCLPFSTYTHMQATVDLRNLFRFLAERDDPHAQYEIRQYAVALKELAKLVAPVAMEAFELSRSGHV